MLPKAVLDLKRRGRTLPLTLGRFTCLLGGLSSHFGMQHLFNLGDIQNSYFNLLLLIK